MPDLICLPFPGLGLLALSREQLDAALVAGRAVHPDVMSSPSPATPETSAPRVVNAETMEATTGVPSSWWMTQARERRIPCRKYGRRVRFVPEEVLSSEAYRRRAKE